MADRAFAVSSGTGTVAEGAAFFPFRLPFRFAAALEAID
jgi:hypothetical protein